MTNQAIKLYPPNIEGTLPAFYGTTLVVPFSMNKTVSQYQVSDFVIKIKTVQSNKYLITKYASSFSFDPKCEVVFQFEEDEIKKLNPGQYYKIQLAYISKYHDDVDGYDKELIGYYSTVGVIKYTVKPNVYISGLEQG